ncbi:hypothetical protein [Jeotgalibacillus salarius]|uniref:Uncharacterized protein n=1 Tax=Jeotgalibacillus salarius TaxID=546023 RepID=A0A4Y8LIV6_9BACL|nr:hypothetical protein [Jeotgalibacillus salarius]TFE02868.1 hypothetical protein E2626_03410 [Jeotgalibacillus salarius]
MSNEVTQFENKYLQAMVHLAIMEKQQKELTIKVKDAKAELEDAMAQHDIKSIDNDFLKVTWVKGSSSKSIDIKKLQEKEPKLYGELLEDYPKVTDKKAYVKFTVK